MLDMINSLEDKDIIILVNKCDLTKRLEPEKIESLLNIKHTMLEVSTKNNSIFGLMDLLERIVERDGFGDEVLLLSHQQVDSLKESIENIKKAKDILKNMELELFSYHIRYAIESIESITKPYNVEDMLDKMFGEFCLGK